MVVGDSIPLYSTFYDCSRPFRFLGSSDELIEIESFRTDTQADGKKDIKTDALVEIVMIADTLHILTESK